MAADFDAEEGLYGHAPYEDIDQAHQAEKADAE